MGARGAGSVEEAGLGTDEVPVLMATLGKAMGCAGAFVAGDEALIEHLMNHARTWVYTTALPPPVAAAALRALSLLDEEPERRSRVLAHAERFRATARDLGYTVLGEGSAIAPVVLGGVEDTLRAAAALEAEGLLVRHREGRRNSYELHLDHPLRHPIEKHRNVEDLVSLILG